MANTRFYNDEARIIKQLQQSTDPGRWILNVPGNGDRPSYMEDSHIRMQKWGGNLMTNPVDLESKLRGITNIKNKCDIIDDPFKIAVNESATVSYPTNTDLYTDQMRYVEPAWELRNAEISNWKEPLGKIENVRMIPRTKYQINTRNIERDEFDKTFFSSL